MSPVLAKGATSKTVYVLVRGSATTPVGMGLTGLAFGTAGLKFYYTRAGAAAVAITLATQTVTGAWATGGFVEVDATNAPGLYRLDVPNAALASGVDEVVITWTGANTVEDGLSVALTSYDPIAAAASAWDDDRASHVTAGTFGEGVVVGSIAANAITAAATATDFATELNTGIATSAALAAAAADITTVVSGVATILAATETYKKAVAVSSFGFYLSASDGTAATGKTVSAQISQDGGAFAAVVGSVTEIGSGFYRVDLSAGEMNGDEILFSATATGAIPRAMKIRTQS